MSRTVEKRTVEKWQVRDRATGLLMSRTSRKPYQYDWEANHGSGFGSQLAASDAALLYMRRANYACREVEVVHSQTTTETIRLVTVDIEPTVVEFFDLTYTPE